MSLSDQVITLSITLENKAATQAGFGTPLLLGYHTAWPVDLVREYSDADEMLDDGFDTTSQLYQDALIVCSQDPHPATFKVGRRTTALTQVVEIVPTVTAAGFHYTGTIDAKAFDITNPASPTVASICTALAAAINALNTGVTAVGTSGTKVVITASTPGAVHAMWFAKGVDITDATVDSTTDDELVAIAAADPDWYGLIVSDSQSKSTGLLQASWTEAQNRLGLFQTADSAVLSPSSTTDVLSAMKAASYKNTPGVYHRRIGGTERLNAGWLSRQLVLDPGLSNPAWKSISGVSVDALGTTEMNSVLAKNGSVYVADTGLNVTFEGKTPSGQFFDTTRGIHWFHARAQEAILTFFASTENVPYTDEGVEMLKNAIRPVVALGQKNNFFSTDVEPTITAPRARSVSAANRVNRRLPDVVITAALGGSINGVTMRATISV